MAIKMGKSKQAKEKKFDRSVEISAPILDPEIIKAIHSPPPEHAGFKELLSGINNQDSIDEVTPLDDRHIPSYIGIACAVSGYTSYSSHARQAIERARGNTPIEPDDENNGTSTKNNTKANTKTTSRPTSPVLIRPEQHINHITLDRSHINSPDEERKELTERLTASANEHWRSPSPTIPPTEDDRHHGAYVGARYFPLTPPAQLSNNHSASDGSSCHVKHIPLLGIDDDEASREQHADDDGKKNEQRIASLYGEDFAKDWGEKEKKMKKLSDSEQIEQEHQSTSKKTPKDLVKLKPTSKSKAKERKNDATPDTLSEDFVKAANAKDKAKNFFSKMFGGSRAKSPSNSTDESKEQPKLTPQARNETESPKCATQVADPAAPEESEEISRVTGKVVRVCAKPAMEIDSQIVDAPKSNHADHDHHDDNEDLVAQSQQNKQDDLVNEDESELTKNLNESCSIKQKSTTTTTEVNQEAKVLPEMGGENSKLNVEIAEKQQEQASNKTSHDGRYYLELLSNERLLLENLVKEAEAKLPDEENQEEISGKIRSAIGKANLLITKKFKQFEELCDANINKSPGDQFATLDDDLAGFWDMILIQVDDIKKAFKNLDENPHESSQEQQQAVSADSLCSDDSATPTTSLKATNKPKLSAQKDQERRGRLQEHINQMKAKASSQGNNEQDDDLILTRDDHILDEQTVASSAITTTTISDDTANVDSIKSALESTVDETIQVDSKDVRADGAEKDGD